MKSLQKFRDRFGRIVIGIGYLGLAALIVIAVVVAFDVIFRKATNSLIRIEGSNEVTALFMVVVSSLWIPAVQVGKEHIWVPMIVERLPYRLRCFWCCAVSLLETAFILALIIGAYRKFLDLFGTGRASDVMRLPHWVFAVIILIAFFEYFVLSLVDTIQFCADGMKCKPSIPEVKEGHNHD